ncbi:MAG: hypothetical protein AABY87_07560 [bacterium]
MAKEEIAERGIAAGIIREEFARHNIEVKSLLLFGSRARAMEQREHVNTISRILIKAIC